MEHINLLEFLNRTKELYAPDFTACDRGLFNFLDLLSEEEQFTQKIDLGLFFVAPKTLNHFVVVDGFNRLLSLSLLLHAVCECYKKTSPKNDNAIKVIRKKYLVNGSKTKLRLSNYYQIIYDKIIFGERLSGKEKESPLFKLLHELWSQVKENELQAASIFKMLQKVSIYLIETESICNRDLYYSLNRDKRELDQLLFIESYLKSMDIVDEWVAFKKVFRNKKRDIYLFFKDFFITKFSFKIP